MKKIRLLQGSSKYSSFPRMRESSPLIFLGSRFRGNDESRVFRGALQSVFVLLMMCLLGALPVQAQTADAKAIEAVGGNSLAEHHIVLQETDSDLQRQTLVLNVASNLLKAYGDNADIEIVAFGPGITLLFANNEHAKRIESLSQQGVRFSACMNALKNATQRLGYEPKLNPVAKKVPAGIVRVIDLVDAGYILVRP